MRTSWFYMFKSRFHGKQKIPIFFYHHLMIYHYKMITKGYQPYKRYNHYSKEKAFFLPSLENAHFTKTWNLSKISLNILWPCMSLCRFRIIFGQTMIFMINKQISKIRLTLLSMKVNNRIVWIEYFSANRLLNSTIFILLLISYCVNLRCWIIQQQDLNIHISSKYPGYIYTIYMYEIHFRSYIHSLFNAIYT